MEINGSSKNNGPRLRAFAFALVIVGLGLVATHHSSAPVAQSGEDRQSPEESAGLRPAGSSGTSFSRPLETQSAAKRGGESYTITRETRLKQSAARLKYLDHCAHVECPNFNAQNPWSYDLDVNKQIARELEDYALLSRNPDEIEKVARYFLKTGNDDIKEAALELLAKSPITENNMKTAFVAMSETVSAPLTKQFLKSPFAMACSDRQYASLCSAWIKDRMRRGGENVQKTLARYSLDLTNESTASLFAQLERREAQRDPFSLKTRYLRANNAEFGRQRNGG